MRLSHSCFFDFLHFFIMRTIRNIAILLGLSAGLSLVSSPAKAGICLGSQFLAGTCPAGWNTVTSAGGIQYTAHAFTFGGVAGNTTVQPADTIEVTGLMGTQVSVTYTLSPILGAMAPTARPELTGQYTYTLSIDTPGYFYEFVQANITGSNLGGGSFQTTLSETTGGDFAALTAGSSPLSNPSPTGTVDVNGLKNFIDVKQEFSRSGDPATIGAAGGNFTSKVPGPLPILGAGAAFGFSRKLRNRIKASA